MSEQLPPPDSERIKATFPTTAELARLAIGTELVRIHPLGGPHPLQWNEFRAWGPTKSRFDHHTLPRREHPRRRIAYLTAGDDAFIAAIAEYFQDDSGAGVQPIDAHHFGVKIVTLALREELVLLDLDSGWVTRAGGNQAIRTGARHRARAWAHAIYRHHGDRVQGLAYGSSVWGPGRCVALFERARTAFPKKPSATRMLGDPAMAVAVSHAAATLDTYVL